MKKFYRQATPEELHFYQSEVYPLQDRVFESVALYGEQLYLTGGTALARFYFQHRLSEDLDFFTPTDNLREIANDLRLRLIDQGFEVEVSKLEIYFANLFIVRENYRLKVEFARKVYLYAPLVCTDKNIFVNNLVDIGASKITAFEDRAAIKDIVDLYYITQEVPWAQLFAIADTKRVPVAYENLLSINTTGIAGYALTTEELAPQALADFVADLKIRVETEVKKKERLATEHVQEIAAKLLWEFPCELRNINEYSAPLLMDRLNRLSLPEKMALERALE